MTNEITGKYKFVKHSQIFLQKNTHFIVLMLLQNLKMKGPNDWNNQ